MSLRAATLALLFLSGCNAVAAAADDNAAFEAAKSAHADLVKSAEKALAGLHQKAMDLDGVARNDTLKARMADHIKEQSGAEAEKRDVVKKVRSAEADVKSQLRGMEKSAKQKLREVSKSAQKLKKLAKENHVENSEKIFDQAEDKIEDMEDRVERQKEDAEESAERISQDVEQLVERAFEKRWRAEEAKERAAKKAAKKEKERAAKKAAKKEKEAAEKKAKEEAKDAKAAPASAEQTLAVEPSSLAAVDKLMRLCAALALVSMVMGFAWKFRSQFQQTVAIPEAPLLG